MTVEVILVIPDHQGTGYSGEDRVVEVDFIPRQNETVELWMHSFITRQTTKKKFLATRIIHHYGVENRVYIELDWI